MEVKCVLQCFQYQYLVEIVFGGIFLIEEDYSFLYFFFCDLNDFQFYFGYDYYVWLKGWDI